MPTSLMQLLVSKVLPKSVVIAMPAMRPDLVKMPGEWRLTSSSRRREWK